MGMGIARLVFLGMGVGTRMAGWEWVGIKPYIIPFTTHRSLSPSFSIVICRRLQTVMSGFTTSSTGMGAGVNGNNQWEWE